MAQQEQPKEDKSTREKFWESTRKTFHVAATEAQKYTRRVQKRIDLATAYRKIPAVHAELGKVIEDLHSMGETNLLDKRAVIDLLEKLHQLRQMTASLEREIEERKKEDSAPPQGTSPH